MTRKSLYSVAFAVLLLLTSVIPVSATEVFGQRKTSCPSMTYTFTETQLSVRVFGMGDYVSGTVTDNKTIAVIPRTYIWNGWLKSFTINYTLVNDSGLTANLVFEGTTFFETEFIAYCTLRRGTGVINIYR